MPSLAVHGFPMPRIKLPVPQGLRLRATNSGPQTPLSLAGQLPKTGSPGLKCWLVQPFPLALTTLVVQQGADWPGAEWYRVCMGSAFGEAEEGATTVGTVK